MAGEHPNLCLGWIKISPSSRFFEVEVVSWSLELRVWELPEVPGLFGPFGPFGLSSTTRDVLQQIGHREGVHADLIGGTMVYQIWHSTSNDSKVSTRSSRY